MMSGARKVLLRGLVFSFSCLLVLAGPSVAAKPSEKAVVKGKKDDKKEKDDFPEFKKVVKDAKAFKGFFNLWKKEEHLYCEIPSARFDKPFLCNFAIAQGVGRGGLLGGTTLHQQGWLLVWKRVSKKKVHLVRRNTRFRAKKGSPMEKAVAISFTDSIVAAAKVKTVKPGSKTVLVDLAPILLSDMVGLSAMFRRSFGAAYRFDRSRSVLGKVKTFPKNVEIRAACTYASDSYQGAGSVPDTRSVQIVLHYSLSKMPATGYKPRYADDRVGFFQIGIKDFSSEVTDGPMVHYITRWHLEKADTKARVSPPKRPIVFHIEKSVPHRWRPYIREGILEWNKAFRKIGFADAIEVRVQGDDENWDPEDVRYNTIRWITSPYVFAIGPSRINPLTGQILDADILVDAGWIRIELEEYEGLFGVPGEKGGDEGDPKKHIKSCMRLGRSAGVEPGRRCSCRYMRGMAHQFNLGVTALTARVSLDPGGVVPDEFIGKALKATIIHEVGHTLGLRHNFKASALRSLEELHDRSLTEKEGLTASVMDYAPVNLAPKGSKQGQFFDSTIGVWDCWAIEYGYKPIKAAKPEAERKELAKIAARGTEPELAYGTDEDAWPVQNRDLDPLCNTWDLGKDPMAWAEQRLGIIRYLFKGIVERVVRKGRSYHRARNAFAGLLYEYAAMLKIIARYIGGQFVTRNHYGDEKATPPFVMVPAKKQRQAMDLLAEHGFSCKYFDFPPGLLNSLAPDWRNDWESPIWRQARLDFPIHRVVERVNLGILARLLDANVLRRILDSEKKFEKGKVVFRLEELFAGLTRSIWGEVLEAKKRSPASIGSYRRGLQRWHARLLGMVVLGTYGSPPDDARALAWSELRTLRDAIQKALARKKSDADRMTRVHLEETADRIRKILDARVEFANQ